MFKSLVECTVLSPGTQQGMLQTYSVELQKHASPQDSLTRPKCPFCWLGSPHQGHSPKSPLTCRHKSAKINGAATAVKMHGPYNRHLRPRQPSPPPMGMYRVFNERYMNQLTASIIKAVMPKLNQWPSVRAKLLTVPLTNPITKAGQHQAPMRAGMLNTNVNNDTIKEALPSSSSSSGFSALTKVALTEIVVWSLPPAEEDSVELSRTADANRFNFCCVSNQPSPFNLEWTNLLPTKMSN